MQTKGQWNSKTDETKAKRVRKALEDLSEIIPVAIYARISDPTTFKKDDNSTHTQIDRAIIHVESNPKYHLTAVYTDGKTAAHTRRKDLQAMLADAREGKFRILIVVKLDRFARNFDDGIMMRAELTKLGVKIIPLDHNIADDTAHGRHFHNMQLVNAELERATIIERVTARFAYLRKMGRWLGTEPYGYTLVDKHLQIVPLEADTVRKIFRLYLEHKSATIVADLLRRERCPTKVRRHKSEQRNARMWTKKMVLVILHNAVYAGVIVDGDFRHKGLHEPIVTLETFEQAQALLSSNTIEGTAHGRNPDYILRGLLRCDSSTIDGSTCGHTLTPASTRKNDREYRYYRCVGYEKKGRRVCPCKPLPAEALERFALSHIRHAASDETFMVKLQTWITDTTAYRRDLTSLRAKLSTQSNEKTAECDRLMTLLPQTEDAARKVHQNRINAIATEILTLEQQTASMGDAIALLHNIETESAWLIEQLSHIGKVWDMLTPENRARLLSLFVEAVTVNEQANSVAIVISPFGQTMSALTEQAFVRDGNDRSLPTPPETLRVTIQAPLLRIRQRSVNFRAPQADQTVARKPAAVAHMLALAHRIDRGIRGGLYTRDSVLGLLGISRPRLKQLLLLPLLAPDLQETILFLTLGEGGAEPVSERVIRPIACAHSWSHQRALWARDIAPQLAPATPAQHAAR